MNFVHFPGLSSSSDQVLIQHTVPGGPYVLIASPVPAAQFPRCTMRALSQVCWESPLGSWSQAMTLLKDVNRPRSQEDMVSHWEPTHSLVEDVSLQGQDCSSSLLSGHVCCRHASLPLVEGEGACMQPASSFLAFTQSFVLWAVQAAC